MMIYISDHFIEIRTFLSLFGVNGVNLCSHIIARYGNLGCGDTNTIDVR